MDKQTHQQDLWESVFRSGQDVWGWQPSPSAIRANEIMLNRSVKTLLIPGFGYGRNAQPFISSGMSVMGIEISATAIDMARRHLGSGIVVHHGSVTQMPFDAMRYDGIFCYALIHLLDTEERAMVIRQCYDQLNEGGTMIFVVISKEASTYGQGACVSEDRYEIHNGVRMYFYDRTSISREFDRYGLESVEEIIEQFPFFMITCRK